MRPFVFLARHRSALRCMKKAEDQTTLSSADFPLIQRITARDNSAKYSIAWTFALGMCWALSIYQMWDRLHFYLNNPIRSSVTTYRNKSLVYPMLTACSMTTRGEATLRKIHAAKRGKKLCNYHRAYWYYGEDLNMSYTSVIQHLNFSSDIFHECYLKQPPSAFYDWCEVTWVESFHGPCMTLSSRFPANYSSRNIFSIFAWAPEQPCRTAQLKVLIHEYEFEAVIQSLFEEEFIEIDLVPSVRESFALSVTELNYLNTPKNPCTDEDSYKRCVQQEFHKAIEDSNLTCIFPFLGTSTLDVCEEWNDLYKTQQKLTTVFKSIKEPCPRKCHEIIFRRSYGKRLEDPSRFYSLYIEYMDNLVSVSEEYYAYSFVSLICDVGGNVGLCLGLCLVSLLETLELFWKSLFRMKNRRFKMNHCHTKRNVVQ